MYSYLEKEECEILHFLSEFILSGVVAKNRSYKHQKISVVKNVEKMRRDEKEEIEGPKIHSILAAVGEICYEDMQPTARRRVVVDQ